MNAEQMRSKIVELVTTNGGALFHEIMDEVGIEGQGNYIVSLADHQSTVLWTGVSQIFVEAFSLALQDLEMKRANPIMYAYFSDEVGFPNFPVVSADAWAKNELDFPTPHWLPLVFFRKQGEQNESDTKTAVDSNTSPLVQAEHLDPSEAETQAG
jgi:hypothetical protein